MPPKSAEASLQKMQEMCDEVGGGRIATLVGRYFAMDRDRRWERIQKAFNLITLGEGEYEAADALQGLALAYERGETDEFVAPTRIGERVTVEDGDVIINMNYRSDRARQITYPFIYDDFDEFERKGGRPKIASYVSLTEYKKDFDIPVAYPAERLVNTFGEYIANLGLHQLRIAETEKYAHVTFFFNGGVEQPNEGEDRILVQSPDVATYDLQPEMSAYEVTDKLVEAIESGSYDAIICNYANGDMVGHSGIYEAAVKAIEVLDECIGRVTDAALKAGGEVLITADHGNAEQMLDTDNDQPHTAHTTNLVPLIYVGEQADSLVENGALCDISPTLLQMMGLKQPVEMTGRSLLGGEP
jgi:2,3-bisphosphoglycerate-independent phosphoglycerate mutase